MFVNNFLQIGALLMEMRPIKSDRHKMTKILLKVA